MRVRFAQFVMLYPREIARSFVIASLIWFFVLAFADPAIWVHRLVALGPDSTYNRSVEHAIVNKTYRQPVDILALGGSSLHDAVPELQEAETVLAKQCGGRVNLFNAATSGQHATDGWAIVEALEGPPPKIIFVGLSAGRLDSGRGNGPYALVGQKVALPHSPTAAIMARDHGSSSVEWFDFFAQFRRLRDTLAVSLAQQVVTSGPNSAIEDQPLTSANALADYKKHLLLMKDIENEGEMTAYWVDFARRMQKRGSEVYFIWTPIAPVGQALDARFAPNKTRALGKLGQVASVLDLSHDPQLTLGDFRNTLHLSTDGATKLWPVIIRRLAALGLCRTLVDRQRDSLQP
jgi:hypothetical protein